MPQSEFDVEARYASLDERVRSQREQITSIESEMRRQHAAIVSTLAEINTKIADTSKPQWQALGVMLTAIVVVGSLAYWPIRETQQRIETDVTAANATVQTALNDVNRRFGEVVSLQQFSEYKSTYENNRALERVDNTSRFEKLEREAEETISRAEHARIVENINQRFTDMQRQVDQNTNTNASVYTPRDQLLQLTRELDELKNRSSTQ